MKKEMKNATIIMIILIITTLIGYLTDKTLHLSGLLYIITLLFTTPAWILITITSIIYVIYLAIKPNKTKN